jgi:hypothetical protein
MNLYEKMRVVNVSLVYPQTGMKLCEERIAGPAFLETKDSILWVLGAANDSLIDPINRCPQSVRTYTYRGHTIPLNNTIVVAGTESESELRFWPQSNRGAKYADIATAVYPLQGPGEGTSYAAPRVSRVAADIFSMNPHFFPEEVRNLIFAGALIPYENSGHNLLLKPSRFLRAGGVLHRDRALRMSDYFKKNRLTMNHEHLQEALKNALEHEGKGGVAERLAPITLEFLQERELLIYR